MNEYLFTFGYGQPNQGLCQPIFAVDERTATLEMKRLHGDQWAFRYTRQEWNNAHREFPAFKEVELTPIYLK